MASNISLTYEKLFDITRKEKNTEELQQLEKDFFNNLIEYLNDKKNILTKEKQASLFSKSEKEMTAKQLDNIKKLITELTMRREQKLMNLAIIKSRTKSSLIDTSSLLEEEKTLFKNMVAQLDEYKDKVLFKILAGTNPEKLAQVSNTAQENSISSPDAQNQNVKIEATDEIPKFIGKEMEAYGPFQKGQSALLPFDIANILIKKGRAKKIE